jgi:hypothetical protein
MAATSIKKNQKKMAIMVSLGQDIQNKKKGGVVWSKLYLGPLSMHPNERPHLKWINIPIISHSN